MKTVSLILFILMTLSAACGGNGEIHSDQEETAPVQAAGQDEVTGAEAGEGIPGNVQLFLGRLGVGFTVLKTGFPAPGQCFADSDSARLSSWSTGVHFDFIALREDTSQTMNCDQMKSFMEARLRDNGRLELVWGASIPYHIGTQGGSHYIDGFLMEFSLEDQEEDYVRQLGEAYCFSYEGFACLLVCRVEEPLDARAELLFSELESMADGMYFDDPGQPSIWPDYLMPEDQ